MKISATTSSVKGLRDYQEDRVICKDLGDFLLAAHLSAESGHQAMLQELGVKPILHLEMRLGEGTGACIAMGLIEAAVKLMREMATFESAAVSGKRR